MVTPLFLLPVLGCSLVGLEAGIVLNDTQMHPLPPNRNWDRSRPINIEATARYWQKSAQDFIREKLKVKHNYNIAKNVILFLGDGMSMPTMTASRVYKSGVEDHLSFDSFPYTALSKIYCANSQSADSACAATAYLGGVKGNLATIGVTAAVEHNNCDEMVKKHNQVTSIAKWSQDAGKRTGIVTTASVTDASPTGIYAHTANRLWQDDTAIKEAGLNATKCRDIAYQLIKEDVGQRLNIILGGGSKVFLPKGTEDELGSKGTRSDGRHLINEWLEDKSRAGQKARYVWKRGQLLHFNYDTEYVLGLFGDYNMPFNLDRDTWLTPSLEEMTEAAIKLVSKGNGEENGYFLFIEGGRIDHAHHLSLAHKALDETVEFSKAVQKALEMTNEDDTLIVVTADHAHTLTMSGFTARNNDIFGSQGNDVDGNMMLSLNYANGPGYKSPGHDLRKDDSDDKNYLFPSLYHTNSGNHGAEDVAIFARGPWAHLFAGVMEENVIPHIMAYASCVGSGRTVCSEYLN